MRQTWETEDDQPLWEIETWWASARPPTDQHCTTLLIAADSEREAHLIAAQWTLANPSCAMPTRTRTLGCAI